MRSVRDFLAPMTIARWGAAVLLALAVPARGGEIRGECDIRFLGTSTLHDFSGKARCRPFVAAVVKGPDGGLRIPVVEADVPVDEMDTGNKVRDRQMRGMFRSERFPRIHGVVRGVDVDVVRRAMGKGGDGKVALDLSLRIRDVERVVPAMATRIREEGGQVFFDLEFPLSLRDFGLKPPSFLFIARVGDRVTVKGNFRLIVSSNE